MGHLLLTKHVDLRNGVNIYLLLTVGCSRFSVDLLRCLLSRVILYEENIWVLVIEIRVVAD